MDGWWTNGHRYFYNPHKAVAQVQLTGISRVPRPFIHTCELLYEWRLWWQNKGGVAAAAAATELRWSSPQAHIVSVRREWVVGCWSTYLRTTFSYFHKLQTLLSAAANKTVNKQWAKALLDRISRAKVFTLGNWQDREMTSSSSSCVHTCRMLCGMVWL